MNLDFFVLSCPSKTPNAFIVHVAHVVSDTCAAIIYLHGGPVFFVELVGGEAVEWSLHKVIEKNKPQGHMSNEKRAPGCLGYNYRG